jgi:CheY-like chemotaxis protein
MNKELKDLNILIVEDENKNIEIIEKMLLNEGVEKIRSSKCTNEAIAELENGDYPDLILLDLKIPLDIGGVEDSINSLSIIMEIERLNRVYDHQIRIIIISGTTQERGLQKLIERDSFLILHMFDKGLMGLSPDEFKKQLIAQVRKSLNYPIKKEQPKITILENIDRIISKLKEIDNELFVYYHNEVLCNYEDIDKTNEKIYSQAIIIRCGIIIEDILQQFEGGKSLRKIAAESSGKKVTEIEAEDESSVRKKLIKLTGRAWDYDNKLFEVKGSAKISRQACEYGIVVYRSRSYASHNNKTDSKNDNIFVDDNFSKEHALTSITLLTPLLQDYIKYKTK